MKSKFTEIQLRIFAFGVFCYLSAIAIAPAVISYASVPLFKFASRLLFAISLLIAINYLSYFSIKRNTIYSIIIIFLLYMYGIFWTLNENFSQNFVVELSKSIFVIIVGLIFWDIDFSRLQNRLFVNYFIMFSIAVTAFQVASGGIIIDFPPAFVFDIDTELGSQLSYSQGVSAFFAISALMCLWTISNKESSHKIMFLNFILFILFCILSFIGAGRGEFIFLLAVIYLMIFSRMAIGIILIPFIVILYLSIPLIYNTFSNIEIVAVSRFIDFIRGDDLGTRDILFGQSIDLILQNPRCLLLGCGFDFFQNYYSYPQSLYPHNILLESIITFGFFMNIVIIGLFIIGIKYKNRSPLYFIGIYFVFISMKSGNLVGAWFTIATLMHFVGLGLSHLFSARTYRRRQI